MNLLKIYKKKNEDLVWRERFFSLAKGKEGRVFKYINTNFRTQSSFVTQFTRFENVEGVARSAWGVQDTHSQEVDKQRVVKLLEAELFQIFKESGEVKYRKTAKGESYKKYIDESFGEGGKWIINYFYLLNGSYDNEHNHIPIKTKEVLNLLNLLSVKEGDLLNLLSEFLKARNKEDLIKKDLFYVMSFYADMEFLEMYFHSKPEEKGELHEYILNNLQQENDQCCISHKYKTGGNYAYRMLMDEVKVFYVTYILLKIKWQETKYVFNKLLEGYNKIFPLNDKEQIIAYLQGEIDVFEPILFDVFGIESDDFVETDTTEIEGAEEKPALYIDTTTKVGRKEASRIFASKRGKAREIANYKCSLEKHRHCQNHYFTSKQTGENYIEVHHLIPKEYSNRFGNSIEVLPNYITLCPNCHQLMHKAVDRERKDHIRHLLDQRKERLSVLNLDVEADELFEFYNIEN